MQVLKWKFSTKFDKIYLDIVKKGINVEFKDISQLENKYLRQYNGLTDANKLDNNKVIVYLNGKIDEKEIEHIAAHELCHIITRARSKNVLIVGPVASGRRFLRQHAVCSA